MSTKQHSITTACLILCLMFITAPYAAAAPAILDAGMSPAQSVWVHEPQFTNKEVKFWLKVQREGNLSQYKTFDYLCKVEVERPGGAKVFSTRIGFNEQGYAEQVLHLPVFLYDRSTSRAAPSFGRWKVRLFVDDRNGKNSILAQEYLLDFRDGKTASIPPAAKGSTGKGYPVPAFNYGIWKLQDWGVGVYDDLPSRSGASGRQFNVLDTRKSFSIREIRSAWNQGHRFGAWLTGQPHSGADDDSIRPPHLFSFILHYPGKRIDGLKPNQRRNLTANSSGSVVIPLELDKPGAYRLIWLVREQNSDAAKESSWKRIGSLSFTLSD